MKGIKELPEFSRPREKLREKGAQSLSDGELIAVLLRSGIKGQEVRSLAAEVAQMLSKKKENITFQDLTGIKGIGLAKAAQILAGFELACQTASCEGTQMSMNCGCPDNGWCCGVEPDAGSEINSVHDRPRSLLRYIGPLAQLT